MSAHRKTASATLVFFLVLLLGSGADPTSNRKRNDTAIRSAVTRAQIIYVTEPEETEMPEVHEIEQPRVTGELCDYDPCRDQQIPCSQLAISTSCLCPGLSGPDVLPQAPHLKSVRREGSEVVVHWCAPASTVLQYRVTVQAGNSLTYGELYRKGYLGELEPGATVCVEAINRAGTSSPSEYSCTEYSETDSLALKAGLIAGGLILLLLLSVVVFLLWRRKSHKAGSNIEGLGNPSFSTEGAL